MSQLYSAVAALLFVVWAFVSVFIGCEADSDRGCYRNAAQQREHNRECWMLLAIVAGGWAIVAAAIHWLAGMAVSS